MTCRNQHYTDEVGKFLANLLRIEKFPSNPESPINNNVEHIIKSKSTKCKSLGHTTNASQDVRKQQFVIMGYFGLNSLFLTLTPDGE